MKDSGTMVNGHYELPLPWRHDYQLLPNNKIAATKRLNSLKKRLSLDPKLKARYVEQMQIILRKGYAEEVPKEEIENNSRIWYIPHHPVFNPKKPEKLRIVYDCAASYSGVSLNRVLMQGPDLVNSIVSANLISKRKNFHICRHRSDDLPSKSLSARSKLLEILMAARRRHVQATSPVSYERSFVWGHIVSKLCCVFSLASCIRVCSNFDA